MDNWYKKCPLYDSYKNLFAIVQTCKCDGMWNHNHWDSHSNALFIKVFTDWELNLMSNRLKLEKFRENQLEDKPRWKLTGNGNFVV